MKVEVLEIRLLNSGKPLRAFADVRLDGSIVVREFRVIKENEKRLRVAPPQLSWKASDGSIQYKTIVTLPDDMKGSVDLAILKRFTEEMERIDGAKE